MIKIVGGIVLALLVLTLATVGVGSFLWNRTTRQSAHTILARADGLRLGSGATVPEATVPAPVRRYLGLAVPGDKRPIRVARVEQTGSFLLTSPDGWVPFTAIQLFTGDPPGMLWDASIRMAPFLSVRVRDSYVAGVGSMRGAMLGLFTVLADSGPDEMAEASLVRYLAESPWFPTRLLPSTDLRWTPVDDSTAVATLTDDGISVSLEFRFAPTGEIRDIYAERRFRGRGEEPEWAPWIGHFSEYTSFDGFRVPGHGEVAWVIDGREQPYWRGRIDAITYQY